MIHISDAYKNISFLNKIEIKDNVIKVCTSGFFDPIHVGHIEYLELAKEFADKISIFYGKQSKLYVLVNTDNQAINKKGYCFMPMAERIKIVKSLKCVDDVKKVIDNDSTVCQTLLEFKPNFFVKGGDRIANNIPEAKICDELGVGLVYGLGDKIQSSSELVKKMKEIK
jgi:D-beta-D-heptose 7-phosphate kinase/D-beta-D-heptose 1-phosphate adenosyltransferase